MAIELIGQLLHQALAVSLAMLVVLALRVPVRRAFGARVAYMLWLVVPAAMLALALPGPAVGLLDMGVAAIGTTGAPAVTVGIARMLHPVVAPSAMPDGLPDLLLAVWLVGLLATAVAEWRAQHRFRSALGTLVTRHDGLLASASSTAGPLVIGVWRPRIVLPADFESRYLGAERALVLAHERTHVRRGDIPANLLATALGCVHWFNPLAQVAVARFRLDQELACDAVVLSRHPGSRRTYADAMLKAQLAVPGLPVGCHWQSSQSLKERIHMLKTNPPTRTRRVAGLTAMALLLTATSYAAWALQPGAKAGMQGTASPSAGVIALDAMARPAAMSASASPPATARVTPSASIAMLPVASGAASASASADGGAAKVNRTPAPPYPPAALAARQSGRVLLHVLVGIDGQVRDVRIVESVPTGVFDAVSIEAARAWTLAPELRDGKPVEAWLQVPIAFEPDAPKPDAVASPPAPPAAPAAPAPPAPPQPPTLRAAPMPAPPPPPPRVERP